MPIMDRKQTAPAVETPSPLKTTPASYQGVTVDTRYQPTDTIVTFVEGAQWTVNYYSQVLAADSQLSGQQPNLPSVLQQYRLVRDFVLKVTSPLSTDQNPESGSLTITGSALVLPSVIPNVGDMFLADIGDGREAIFQVNTSTRKSHYKETVHEISYTLINYSTDELRGDLNSKVLETFVFVRDYLLYGQNPVILSQDWESLLQLKFRYKEIVEQYFHEHFSREYSTLLVSGQEGSVYDHFLTTALLSVVETTDGVDIRRVRRLNVDGDDVMKSTTLWDVLVKRQRRLLKHAIRQVGVVSPRLFTHDPHMEGIYHSRINYLVYPKNPVLSVDYQRTGQQKLLEDYTFVNPASPLSTVELPLTDGLIYNPAPLHAAPMTDSYYVLSEAFYTGDKPNMTQLERLVVDYLDGKPLDTKLLVTLCDSSHAWGALERTYLIPVILILVKVATRSI